MLPGCGAAAWLAAGTGASLAAIQRDPVDAMVSAVSGRDCSIARIGRAGDYCRRDEAPAPPPYCTRSLGWADCWTRRDPFGARQREIADGPRELTPAQERNRMRGWPGWF